MHCCYKIWNLCGDLRSVTHDFELGGAILADRTVIWGGSRHQLDLVALVDVVLWEAPPTDEEACLSTQTALCWSDGVHLGLWNHTQNQFNFNWLYSCNKRDQYFYCDNIVAIYVQKVVFIYWNTIYIASIMVLYM